MATILFVDDEPSIGSLLDVTLTRAGHTALGTRDVPDAMQVLSRESVDLIIADYRMPGVSGLEFLELLQREGHEVPLIMLTGHGNVEHAATAIKAGAIDYVTKPIRAQQLELAVDQALEFVRLRRENEALARQVMELHRERSIIGESATLRRILQTIAMVAPTRASVLLQGESGTGKALFARAIHDQSDRRAKPFITLDCAALPEELLESALLGDERGTSAGANKLVQGAFERAHGGTLLLDEIAAMKLDLQPKLLRVLQEQEFERVGGRSPVRVDVRVISTTTRNLANEVSDGRLRHDLCHALSAVPIEIPPLRERPDDIVALALGFAKQAAVELNKSITGLAPQTLERLLSYPWPGNVRELRQVVERAVILSRDSVLEPDLFEAQRTPSIQPAGQVAGPSGTHGDPDERVSSDGQRGGVMLHTLNVDEAERALIKRALEVTGNNRTRAAELLGISVRTLRNKLNVRSSVSGGTDNPRPGEPSTSGE